MSDAFYSQFTTLASGLLNQFKQGTVQLKRLVTVPGEKPWKAPSGEIVTTYDMDTAVRGVDKKKVDGTRITTSDLEIITSPRMRLNGVYVDIEPTDRDQIVVRGKQRAVKQVDRIPASGPVVVYKLYVEGP